MLRGSITIDKAKLDETLSLFSCVALYIARIMLFIAAGIFGLLAIASGGDARMNDGDPTKMLISLGLALMCAFSAMLVRMFIETIAHNARIRNLRRKHARIRKSTKKAA